MDLYLNNDVTLEPDWLERLMASWTAERPDAWFATGKLLDARGPANGSMARSMPSAAAVAPGDAATDARIPMLWNRPRTIQLAPFTAAVFRAQFFERVGLLDERSNPIWKTWISGCAAPQAGLSGIYVPEAVAYHRQRDLGPLAPGNGPRISRNQLLLVAKHYPPNWILRYGWPVFVAQALWGFVALRHGALSELTWRAKSKACGSSAKARGEYCARLSPAILEQSEHEIREMQESTGFDLYWRLYFALT